MQKRKNNKVQPKFTGSYKKKKPRVMGISLKSLLNNALLIVDHWTVHTQRYTHQILCYM